MQATTEKHRLLLCSADPVWVKGDRERLDIALRHLVDNAIRYSPEGGDVDVEVVEVDGFARVTVIDHGLGIFGVKQKHVFEPFFQVYPALAPFGGIGLGLYVSKRIVEAHDGKIWFESEEGLDCVETGEKYTNCGASLLGSPLWQQPSSIWVW